VHPACWTVGGSRDTIGAAQRRLMARLQRRRFSETSDVRRFPHGRVDVVEMDDHIVGQMTYEPGWRWSIDVKPIAGTESCQYHHLGYTVSGRLRLQMPDGTELEVGPGEVFEAPPGHDAWVVGDEPWVGVDFEAMRTYGQKHDAKSERTLASIVITDIVDSTRRATELGATGWRDVIAEHNRKASTAIDRQRGRLVKTTGDGVIAVFDGAERAVRAAVAIRGVASVLDLEVRAGIHSGEVVLTADDVRGIAVHTTARIMAAAAPDEILVSATVMDLVDGSGLAFEDAGLHELKGLSGKRQLFRLAGDGSVPTTVDGA
jgi:class 3 adenylate cyclase/mannose-6-phosphate isomerase-like protein (cupin superfamily)